MPSSFRQFEFGWRRQSDLLGAQEPAQELLESCWLYINDSTALLSLDMHDLDTRLQALCKKL